MPVGKELDSDLMSIMNKNLPQTEKPESLFLKQQLQAFNFKNKRSIRWHPIMIKFCLCLHHKSSSAYGNLESFAYHQEEHFVTIDSFLQLKSVVLLLQMINNCVSWPIKRVHCNGQSILASYVVDEMH